MWGGAMRCRSYPKSMRFALNLIAATLAAADYTTYIGVTYPYSVCALTTDASGNTYITGSRNLAPASLTQQTDVFLTKLDPNGNILFTKTFGGSASASSSAIALDPSGNIYIAGNTTSSDFPLSNALQTQVSIYNGPTGFVLKLTNNGATILYSTYFGGTQGPSYIGALTTDAKGNLYLTGASAASDFPQTSGIPNASIAFRLPATQGAIVAAISAAGDKILYSGAIAGYAPACAFPGSTCDVTNSFTEGVGIALDAAGNAYIAGDTNTTDLPVTPGAFSPKGIGAFVAKITAGGTSLAYVTYLDSGQATFDPLYAPGTAIYAIAVDSSGNAYLAGSTNDSNFPATPGSLQPTFGSGPNPFDATNVPADAFLAKLNPSGSALVWATFLGGTGSDGAQSIAVDPAGNVWATGTTNSPNFPNAQGTSQGGDFLVEANPSGSALLYAARYPTGTVAGPIAIDPSGNLHVAGANGIVSEITPAVAPSITIFGFQNAAGGKASGQISPAEVISIYGQKIGPSSAMTAAPINGSYPATLGGVQVTINGANIPLLYVSATQINAVVPMGAPIGAATVQVINGTTSSPNFSAQVVSSLPQAFAGVLNQDGTLNSQTNPATAASIITFYATGWQSNFYPLTDGQVATKASDVCPCLMVSPSNATILYAGAAPGIVAGVTQFNVMLPAAGGTVIDLFPFGSLVYPEVPVWVRP
jgi:uncharacterized protein (TIGR03437 family)